VQSFKPLAITMGEPAGIGPDLILKLFSERAAHDLPPFAVYANAPFLAARAARLGLDIAFETVGLQWEPSVFVRALPVRHIEGRVADQPGKPDPAAALVVINAIAQAVEDTQAGYCSAVVTAPIHKAALYGASFAYPGHTEYLAALCARNGQTPLAVMMLAQNALRAVPVTIHVPLADVPRLLTQDLIARTARIVAQDLQTRFGIAQPRLALAGLNPHAGENGAIGHEDATVIAPAIATLQAEGINAQGPFPADTLFYPPHWRQYDAVLAMYHDQALIPIKTVAFEDAANITLGLPIVRTSPDHGTAFDLAGTGKGSVSSFLAAIRVASQMTGIAA
jgi:4-hydroxythreonine-4-phosphate dehydrogenase